ncbi:MAG: hypothetical protein AVDCRST_MAG85-970 [uncultured Solirubrobacteraceae bacterium]|uniref:DUF4240 domain-containing protein n=1 Tax=uncultured Solirubrobacteraceae bacterium TaxID=1162706 RepID=A0A6J4S023_9ACTN|nr:MAG: hypothetical protein AVDCRST_MAG85-970 [uncultured Solirubrobacteraceae bacterium]
MDEGRFWALVVDIEPTVADDPLAFDEALSDALVELPPSEVVAFANAWTRMANRAFTWDLWAAAWLLRGDAFDWEFTGFRDRLIALGQTVYERALADADSLADIPIDWHDGEEGGDVWLSLAAADAYERLTGGDIADAEPAEEPEPLEPAGEPWSRLDEPETRVPRILERTGPLELPELLPCPTCGHLTLAAPDDDCDVCVDARPPRPWEIPRG